MQRYCLGFAMCVGWVLLIEKIKPEWQRGRLNGVGGKVEDGEDPQAAMAREFQEEAGFHTKPEDWSICGTMTGQDWVVHVYCYEIGSTEWVKSMTEEQIKWVPLKHVHSHPVIENIPALVELCRMRLDNEGVIPTFTLHY